MISITRGRGELGGGEEDGRQSRWLGAHLAKCRAASPWSPPQAKAKLASLHCRKMPS